MRKNILFYVLLLFCNVSLNAQNDHNENWYRNYFKEHIEELDPIEGIYSLTLHNKVSYMGDNMLNDFTNSTVAIIKKGAYYEQYELSKDKGGRGTIEFIRFYPIGETQIYDCKWKWFGCSDLASCRVVMDNMFYFKTDINVTDCVKEQTHNHFISMGAKRDKNFCYNFSQEFNSTYFKSFPTRSMYEEAIANAQRKIEEESLPSAWSGSGWALGNGYLVTNYHVVDEARTISVKGIGGDQNTGYAAEVVATDKTNDIAVLKIKDSRFKGFGTIPYAVSSRIADKGEGVFVLGYPMTQVLGNEVKYTAGEINSRTGFQGDVATYQISAPVTHGNSGGPMFDNKGNVIGIVNSGISDKEIAENVGYAIKISYLKILIESAGLNITLPSKNTISTLSKQEKIKKVEKFVYYIECSK